MKNFLLLATVACFFGACKSKNESDLEIKKDVAPIENPAAYQSSALTDVGTSKDELAVAKKTLPDHYRTYKKVSSANKQPNTSNSNVAIVPVPQQTSPAVVTNLPVPPTETATSVPSTVNSAGTGIDTQQSTTSESPIPAKKKGWSGAAKGAVIGGVGGAIAGAVINGKNRGKGAILGGVIGAVGGYVIGKSKDKKSSTSDYVLDKF